MKNEMDAHHLNETWDLTPLPAGQRALSARWVLREKIDQHGKTTYKARVVARGNEQRPGLDYDETFAPVVKWSTIRLIVALAAVLNWSICHMDVVTAFLNGTIKETIFMQQPPGFVADHQKHLVCRLRKSLYGLKQSPRAWYEEVDSFLRTIGCTRSALDPNLYFFFDGSQTAIILLFVDDLLLTGNSSSLISSLKQKLQAKYRMKDLGPVTRYLGVDFLTTSHGILLHQKPYALRFAEQYDLTSCKPVFTPLPENLTLSSSCDSPSVNSTLYCQLVGKLIYLTNTRPNISFSVGLVSRFMTSPHQTHLDAALHIVKYISTTPDLGIFYNRSGTLQLHGYTDSDWGNSCPDTRRSTGGYIFQLAGGPITWSSKRQPTVSRSTTEAEYRALSDGAQEAVYLKRLIQELIHVELPSTNVKCKDSQVTLDLSKAHIPTQHDIHMYCDNASAIKLSRNPVFHARTKHLEVHHHFIRERVLEQEINIQHVSTHDQAADILTKVLPRQKFEKNRHQLGVRSVQQTQSLHNFKL